MCKHGTQCVTDKDHTKYGDATVLAIVVEPCSICRGRVHRRHTVLVLHSVLFTMSVLRTVQLLHCMIQYIPGTSPLYLCTGVSQCLESSKTVEQ